ncbi:MAG: hypothetical protein KGI51_02250 [Rhodospirillales bacterium]|nr:hypothetical protein [Rhodospirillales bacterium]
MRFMIAVVRFSSRQGASARGGGREAARHASPGLAAIAIAVLDPFAAVPDC